MTTLLSEEKVVTAKNPYGVDVKAFYYQNVKQCLFDFNFFMRYSHKRTGLSVETRIRIQRIMDRYGMKPKNPKDDWSVEEVSNLIFGELSDW